MSWNLGQLNEPAIVFLWHSKMARLRNEYAKLSTIFIGGDDKKLILAPIAQRVLLLLDERVRA